MGEPSGGLSTQTDGRTDLDGPRGLVERRRREEEGERGGGGGGPRWPTGPCRAEEEGGGRRGRRKEREEEEEDLDGPRGLVERASRLGLQVSDRITARSVGSSRRGYEKVRRGHRARRVGDKADRPPEVARSHHYAARLVICSIQVSGKTGKGGGRAAADTADKQIHTYQTLGAFQLQTALSTHERALLT
jgi:hypothetical protein